jgi:hypothetical protein
VVFLVLELQFCSSRTKVATGPGVLAGSWRGLDVAIKRTLLDGPDLEADPRLDTGITGCMHSNIVATFHSTLHPVNSSNTHDQPVWKMCLVQAPLPASGPSSPDPVYACALLYFSELHMIKCCHTLCDLCATRLVHTGEALARD